MNGPVIACDFCNTPISSAPRSHLLGAGYHSSSRDIGPVGLSWVTCRECGSIDFTAGEQYFAIKRRAGRVSRAWQKAVVRFIKMHRPFPRNADVSIRAKIAARAIEAQAEAAAADEVARLKALEPVPEPRVSKMPVGPGGVFIPASYRYIIDGIDGDDSPDRWKPIRLEALRSNQKDAAVLDVTFTLNDKNCRRTICPVRDADDAADPLWLHLNSFERELIIQAQMINSKGALKPMDESCINQLFAIWVKSLESELGQCRRINLSKEIIAEMSQ